MDKKIEAFPRYFIFTEAELLFLIVCVVLDMSEYVATILLLPTVGDFLDIVGIVACLAMFRWIGVVSLLELIPGADIFPIFIITWLIWYVLKKRILKEKREDQKKNWM